MPISVVVQVEVAMLRFSSLLVALTVASAAYGQVAPHTSSKQKTAPAAQKVEDPDDVAAVPRNVQKWFGGAVDDILTGAGKVVDPGADRH